MERLILVLKARGLLPESGSGVDLFFVTIGDAARNAAVELAHALRRQGIRVDLDYRGRSLRKQMKYADQIKARYVIVIGEDEVKPARHG